MNPTERTALLFADLEWAARQRDPDLAQYVIAFLQQPDPSDGEPPEDILEDVLSEADDPLQTSPDAWTLERLRLAVAAAASQPTQTAYAQRCTAWTSLMATAHLPPRLKVGKLLLDLYEAGDESARQALLKIIHEAPIKWGFWQGFKAIYKRVEACHDLTFLGVLAWRLDTLEPVAIPEIGVGTMIYLRRRVWRYLRQLGQAVPALYPDWAVEVLQHYTETPRGGWIAQQIIGHAAKRQSCSYGIHRSLTVPKDLKQRAFHDSWKVRPEPLLRLLEATQNDVIAQFAIRSLEADFATLLRRPPPGWLARLGDHPVPSVHRFIVTCLKNNPDWHPREFKALGLHDRLWQLLFSMDKEAQRMAIAYAREYQTDRPLTDWLQAAFAEVPEVRQLAAAQLSQLNPSDVNLTVPQVFALLANLETHDWAEAYLRRVLHPSQLTQEHFIELYLVTDLYQAMLYQQVVSEFYKAAQTRIPATYYQAVLADRRCSLFLQQTILQQLATYSADELGVEWIKEAVLDDRYRNTVTQWLRNGLLKKQADVEWLKGLVMRPELRALGLELLADREQVKPEQIGVHWLLTMVRHTDETVHRFAQRILLETFMPAQFGTDLMSGVNKLWALATDADSPDIMRAFATWYLKLHHPVLGPTFTEATQYGITPRIPLETYELARIQPLFDDARPDLRRFAVALARVDLLRWADVQLLHHLVNSRYREPRNYAIETLLTIDQPHVDAACIPPVTWLTEAVFEWADSPHKATRETALTLIRRHYETLGSASRLAWLMASPEREVRLFAVKLLWERYRPNAVVTLSKSTNDIPTRTTTVVSESFTDMQALSEFLRKVLFGLPPGRMERRELDRLGDRSETFALPERPLSASESKRRLISTVCELALTDRAFAECIIPVLMLFTHSEAVGEWQTCLATLAQLRRIHPSLAEWMNELPTGQIAFHTARKGER